MKQRKVTKPQRAAIEAMYQEHLRACKAGKVGKCLSKAEVYQILARLLERRLE